MDIKQVDPIYRSAMRVRRIQQDSINKLFNVKPQESSFIEMLKAEGAVRILDVKA